MERFGGVVNIEHRQEPGGVRLSGHAMPGGKLGAPPGALNSGNNVYTSMCGPRPAPHSHEGGNPWGD